MNRLALLLTLFLLIGISAQADDFNKMARKGNEAFKEGRYSDALDYYHQAEVERPETPELDYNIGSALYKESKYEEALDKLDKAMNTDEVEYEARALYNKGNVFYRMGDYKKAIESYTESLKRNSDDIDAKFNLELARKMLKEQTKPQQQDQQQQQQQEQQQQQDQQDQQDEQQQQQPQPQPEDEEQEEQDQQQQPRPEEINEMTEEDAERILNALRDDEKEAQEKQKRYRGRGDYTGKDW